MNKTAVSRTLPPEWAPQSAVMLTWPHQESYWVDTMASIDQVFTQTALEIARRQKVLITCLNEAHELHIRHLLQEAGTNLEQVAFFQVRANDIWVRDHGPITVLDHGKPVLLDFTFTGWGYKYPAEHDNVLTANLQAFNAFPDITLQKIALALEGGGIESDGEGTLLTTTSCLLSKKRNPTLSKEDIENTLMEAFGVNRILWLENGALEGDDTDGHIDTIARFTDPYTICYVACDDKNDPHYETFQALAHELNTLKNFQGEPYRLVPLPWPKARYADFDGRRLPVTYANFLIINDAVLVPTYEDAKDSEALAIIAECFKDREIIAIPSLPVVQWYGSIHCMTMQLPRGVIK
jgi:agmatine deiminase